MIVDCPAGAAESTLFFTSASDIAIVVLVEEPTSFLDAYALIKAANLEARVKNFAVAVNMAENKNMAKNSFEKFREIAIRFLDVNLHYAGMIPYSKEIKHAVTQRRPVTLSRPSSMPSACFKEMAKTLMTVPIDSSNSLKFFDNGGRK